MKIILFMLALFAACSLKAQVSLHGTITDKQKITPVFGAVVYFPDLKSGVVSDADGLYKINNLPKIKTLVQVKALGYKTVILQVDLNTITELNIEMEESVVEVNEVVITGTSHSTDIKRNPIPMISIDQKFLEQNSGTNLFDVIARVPGVNALSTGPNVSKPAIRGLGYNRILTLFDGVRQEGQQWGDEHGVEVDQFLVDRVEVVKGPASLTYGSDALAGVVNLIPANPVAEGTIRGRLLNSYQTNNGQLAHSLSLAGNKNGFIWGTTATHKQAKDYKNKYDGRVYGTGFNENDVNAYLGLNKSWGYSHLNFSLYDNQQEIPDGSRDSASRMFTKQISEEDTMRPIVTTNELNSYKISDVRQRVQHYRLYSNNSFILGKSKLALSLSYQQSIRQEFSHPVMTDLAGLHLKLNTAVYSVKYFLPEYKGIESLVGINGMYQQNNNNKATEFVIPDYTLLDVGAFLFVKKSFSRLDVSGGVRADSRSFKNSAMYVTTNPETGFGMQVSASDTINGAVTQFTDYKHTFTGASGSLGLTYNFSDKFLIKANVARGYRAPNISEISAKGIHPGTGFEQLGDPNFKPEFSLQGDVGIFLTTEHVSGSVEAFQNTISNYIFNQKLNSINGGDSIIYQNGSSYPVFKFRQTEAQLYGGEISIDIHPHPLDWLHFENTLSIVQALNKGGNNAVINDSTKYLPYIPPLHTSSDIRADFKKKVACFTSVYIKVGVQFYAAQNRAFLAYGTETPTPGYTLLDAGVGANGVNKKGKTLFVINITGSNLFDKAYQSNMSRLKYFDNYPVNRTGRSGIYSMGRNISFKLVIPF